MYPTANVSEALPSAHANRGSLDGDDDTASSAPADQRELLLETSSIWDTTNSQEGVNQDTLEAQSKPDFDFDEDENSPASSIHSSVIDLRSAAASDSDFEHLDSDQEFPETDGQSEYRSASNRSNSLAGLFNRAKGQARKKLSVGLPGASTMEAGSSSAAYDDSEWQQAGQNADGVDLAGPGAHGFLECTVSSPQKEAEGTQNAYISYLVTTEARTAQNNT